MRILIFLALLFGACTKKDDKPVTLEARGRTVFAMHCTACHSANPKVDGSLGPAVWGSSLELITARVMKGDYPAGYAPKRTTKTMVALPMLKDEIPALHAYLNSP